MKNLILVVLLTVCGSPALAQFEIALTPSYRFGGSLPVRFNNQFGELQAESTVAFGADVGYDLGNGTKFTAAYTRQVTDIDFQGNGVFDQVRYTRAAIEYITLGVIRGGDFKVGINPFGGATVGVAIFSPQEGDFGNEWNFAMNLKGGFNLFVTEQIGLRVAVGLYAPIFLDGVGIFCQGGGGCNTGVSASSSVLQGDLSTGVIFRLDK